MIAPDDAQGPRRVRLVAEIGRGGMADVVLAVVQGPAGFNKLVVLKKTLPALAADPDILAMFLDEARLAARLNHPNVVQTYEVGQEGERYFIAMEYLDGQPLHRIRSRLGPGKFPLAMQIRVLIDALSGLHHAHELTDFDGSKLGVVHRDATPQNVFVTYDGQIKVVDFGIAKAMDSSTETRIGVLKGKIPYMAPEQARGEPLDRRADIFAVGVMLWEGIAGRRMWKGTPDLAVLGKLIHGDLPPIPAEIPVDPDLKAICRKATAPDPADRYATAIDLQHALERWLAQRGEDVSAREVGAFVAAHFTEDRAKIKGLIESALRDVRLTGTFPRASSGSLPKIDPGPITATPTLTAPETRTPAPSSATPSAIAAPSAIVAPGPDAKSSVAPSRRLLVPAAIGGAIAVACAVAFVGLKLIAPAPADPANSAPAAGTARAIADPPPKSSAAPPAASSAEIAPDARAPAAPTERPRIGAALPRPDAVGTRPKATSSAAAAPPTSTTSPSLGVGQKPQRGIDAQSPYANSP